MSAVREKRRSVGDRAPAVVHYLDATLARAAAAHGRAVEHAAANPPVPSHPFDVGAVRADFPALAQRIHGQPLVWLDNAATTHKPAVVLRRIADFYERENANIHRAAHTLAARATDAYEAAREKVRRFLNAPFARDIVFVRGTTEAINLVAQAWGRRHVGAGDEIVVTALEHHSNFVPWQALAEERGATFRVAPATSDGQIDLDAFERLFTPRTRLAAVTHVSNALGTVTPLAEMIRIAHRHGARVVVDGAQAVSHMPVDVTALDADFYAFSGHKIFGPTGIGVLYGKSEALDAMPPWQYGGSMIGRVSAEESTYQPAPARFEAGTANIAGAVGLGAAVDYVSGIGFETLISHERELLAHGTARLESVDGLRLVGTAADKVGVLSFVIEGIDNAALGAALDRRGIAVRAGHHCAQPALRQLGLTGGTLRASTAVYNTTEDLDVLADTLETLVKEVRR